MSAKSSIFTLPNDSPTRLRGVSTNAERRRHFLIGVKWEGSADDNDNDNDNEVDNVSGSKLVPRKG